MGRVVKEKSDVKRAEKNIEEIESELEQLAMEIEEQVTDLTASFSVDNFEIETFAIKPRRSDIFDVDVFLLWEMVG